MKKLTLIQRLVDKEPAGLTCGYCTNATEAAKTITSLRSINKELVEALELVKKDAAKLVSGNYVIEPKTVDAVSAVLTRAKSLTEAKP